MTVNLNFNILLALLYRGHVYQFSESLKDKIEEVSDIGEYLSKLELAYLRGTAFDVV
jgi:hypothetical protein